MSSSPIQTFVDTNLQLCDAEELLAWELGESSGLWVARKPSFLGKDPRLEAFLVLAVDLADRDRLALLTSQSLVLRRGPKGGLGSCRRVIELRKDPLGKDNSVLGTRAFPRTAPLYTIRGHSPLFNAIQALSFCLNRDPGQILDEEVRDGGWPKVVHAPHSRLVNIALEDGTGYRVSYYAEGWGSREIERLPKASLLPGAPTIGLCEERYLPVLGRAFEFAF